MDMVTIDFETFYDQDYSLSKMTTEEYIRSPLFEVIGVSVKVNDHPPDWYTGDDPGKFLRSLDYTDKAVLCHHTMFDGAIMAWHFGIRPKLWLDTLSMARPGHAVMVGGSLKALASYYGLGAKGTEVIMAKGKRRADFTPAEIQAYGNYGIQDNNLTYALFQKLKVGFPVSELILIDRTIRMYTEPLIQLDRSLLEQHLAEEKARKQALFDALGAKGVGNDAVKKLLNSNAKFAQLLEKLGAEVPRKVSPKTGKLTYAFAKTDTQFTDMQEHENPSVRLLVNARLGTKSTIEETRTQRLIDVSHRGALPIMLNYYGAHTGRYSGGDKLNLQNLPARKNNTIRRALCAPPGKVMIVCDSAQIEARLTSYVAGQDDLTQSFREGRDVHSEFASEVYGRPVDRKRKEIGPDGVEFTPDLVEGFIGKTCILGLGFGMGGEKFQYTCTSGIAGMKVEMERAEADRVVQIYRRKNHRIKGLWNTCGSALNDIISGTSGTIGAVAGGLIPYDKDGFLLPNGMRLQYHGLRTIGDDFHYVNDPRQWKKLLTSRVLNGTPNVDEINWTKIYGGKVVENLIQALDRIIVLDQMVAITEHFPVPFQVHDENIVIVDEDDADEARVIVEQIMGEAPAWAPDLPVACESAITTRYGDAK